MKTKLFLLICSVISIVSCKKASVTTSNNPAIMGTWELRATRNGNILPATYAAGNGHLLIFSNSHYTEFNSGSIVDSGYYTKSSDTTFRYIVYSTFTNTFFHNYILFQQDTLLLKPGQPDISTSYYVKTSE